MQELYSLYWQKHFLLFPIYAKIQFGSRKLLRRVLPQRLHPGFVFYERIRMFFFVVLFVFLAPAIFSILKLGTAHPSLAEQWTAGVFFAIVLCIAFYKLGRRLQFYLAHGLRLLSKKNTKQLVNNIDNQIDRLLSNASYDQLILKFDKNLFILKRLEYHYQKCNQYNLCNSCSHSAINQILSHILALENKQKPFGGI